MTLTTSKCYVEGFSGQPWLFMTSIGPKVWISGLSCRVVFGSAMIFFMTSSFLVGVIFRQPWHFMISRGPVELMFWIAVTLMSSKDSVKWFSEHCWFSITSICLAEWMFGQTWLFMHSVVLYSGCLFSHDILWLVYVL